MSHRYQAVNGTHVVTATQTELTLNGAVIWQGFALFPRVSADGRVAWKRHSDGGAMVFNGAKAVDLELGTVGNWAVCWRPDGALYVQDELVTADAGGWLILENDGSRRRVTVADQPHLANLVPPATGMHHIEADGRIVLNNDPTVAHGWLTTVDGQRIEYWWLDTDGYNQVALSTGGGPAGCVVYVPLGQPPLMWVPPTDIPHPPFISAGRIAISGENPPPVDDPRPENGWRPYEAYVAPQPQLPDLGTAPAGLTLWVGVDASQCETLPPGNFTWSGMKGAIDPRPAAESAASADEWIGSRPLLCGLWLTDNGAAPETVDVEIAFAKQRGAFAVAIHIDAVDAQRQAADDAARRVLEAGLQPVLLAHAAGYPSDFAKALEHVRTSPAWGITLNARTFGKDLDAFAETIQAVGRALDQSGCTALFVFGNLDRTEREWPDFGRWLRELCANTKTPVLKPGQPAQATSSLPADLQAAATDIVNLSEQTKAKVRK